MAILIAGTIPGLPELYNGHTVHLLSNMTKLWTTIERLRPSLIIMIDNMENWNANKFCRDCKQNKNTQHIAIILLSDNVEFPAHADAIIRRPFNWEILNATIEKLLAQ